MKNTINRLTVEYRNAMIKEAQNNTMYPITKIKWPVAIPHGMTRSNVMDRAEDIFPGDSERDASLRKQIIQDIKNHYVAYPEGTYDGLSIPSNVPLWRREFDDHIKIPPYPVGMDTIRRGDTKPKTLLWPLLSGYAVVSDYAA